MKSIPNKRTYISTVQWDGTIVDVIVTFDISDNGKPQLQTVETMQGEQIEYSEWHKWVSQLHMDCCLVVSRIVNNLEQIWSQQ